MGRVGFWACMKVVLFWEVTASGAPGWLRYISAPYLFCSPPTPFILIGFWFVIVFFINLFQKTVFVGLKESTSLWVVIPVEVRLPTVGSPQTPRKRDPHWELVLLLLCKHSQLIDILSHFVSNKRELTIVQVKSALINRQEVTL